MKDKNYPYWNFRTEREWKRDVRKRWMEFRKAYKSIRNGCAFYPIAVKLEEFEYMDKQMKQWFKKA